MKRVFLTMLTACLTLLSCQNDDILGEELQQEDGNKISFTTKGAVVTTSNIDDMTMLCYQTGAANYDENTSLPNHMFWAKVSRNSSGDEYYDWEVEASPVSGTATVDKYWSQGNKHTFVAFAPYDVSLYDYTPSSAESAGLPTFTYTVPEKMVDHKDLTYAITINQLDNFAANEPSKRSVGLFFKHALSKVMFTAQLATGIDLPTGEKFRIAGIAINGIKQSGKFSFEKAETTIETVTGGTTSSADYIDWNLTGVSDANPVYSETDLTYLENDFIAYDSPTTKKINIIAGENALFMIPQSFDTPRTLRISYVHHTVAVPDGILKEYEITLPQNKWEAGKSITYNLKFNPSSGSSPWEADAILEDWEDTQTSVSASEAYFTLTDGKRHYGWSEANGASTTKRTFIIPFETNVPLTDISVSAATGDVAKSEENSTIIYTESNIGSNDRDEITVTMTLRDGEGETAQIVKRNMTIKIGGFEIIEQDLDFGIAIEKRDYYYARYSTKSHMYFADYDMPTEAFTNDPTWTKSTEGYEVDFNFDIYQVNEGQGDIATANPTLILPDGIEIINATSTPDKIYNTKEDWNKSFGEKRLRLRISSEMVGTATLQIGTANKQLLSFTVLDGAVITDYTNQEFVRDLTGLSTTHGGIDGLRVANSYITAPHTDYATIFYIPIKDRVNEFWREYSGVADPELYTITDESWVYDNDYSVELSWYDGTNDGVVYPDIADLQVAKNYSPATNNVSAQNAILVVQPKGFEEQNYVINIKKGGTIIWSIHCWATKYNPYRNTAYTAAPERTDLNQAVGVVGGDLHSYDDAVNVGALTIWKEGGIYEDKLIMDRNVGAISATYAGHSGKGALYYQFGRKDPFHSFSIVSTPGQKSFVDAVINPDKFITSNSNWSNESNALSTNCLWNDYKVIRSEYSTGKSIFDPSPLGFRVPVNGTWAAFTGNNQNNEQTNPQNYTFLWTRYLSPIPNGYDYGRIYKNFVYFPAPGRLDANDASLDYGNGYGCNWSAAPGSSNDGQYLILTGTIVYPTSSSLRSYGFSVRSIQE